jgi:fido (protein-threonine AMPylation protein)
MQTIRGKQFCVNRIVASPNQDLSGGVVIHPFDDGNERHSLPSIAEAIKWRAIAT